MQVDFGIYLPPVGLSYPELVDRARRCEGYGYQSLWLFDHLSTPGLPDLPSFEGWTLATALAAATERIRLGHLVLCNSFRHPALLAKMATSLDVISGGRLDFGIGSGSWEPEHIQAGMAWGTLAERSERLAETLAIVTGAWASARSSFHGRYYQVTDLAHRPGPVQQPHPPIVVGGIGRRTTLPIAARYADVWNLPTYGLEDVDGATAAVTRACEDAGRDPLTLRRSLEAVLVIGADDAEVDRRYASARRGFGGAGFGLDAGGLVGTPSRLVDRIGDLVVRGFSHFVLFTTDRAADATLGLFATEVMPHFR